MRNFSSETMHRNNNKHSDDIPFSFLLAPIFVITFNAIEATIIITFYKAHY